MPVRKSDPPKVHLEKREPGTKQCHAGIAVPILRSTSNIELVTCYMCLRTVDQARIRAGRHG
jgi:hypothetical protein